ncbi:Aste57867_211 [Aphanomyces stellatus]|uniref:Aste57867_211 protein n=1 Tax=Aphanomyces stellatus TaxID=120398 RepID=A0A485K208_9STRA|nr:hypothetical protein As57867_000211 [Aphanomyces stellatus]VFT77437.1 Aste57867_211 [Aphanomyces stellatus]
MGHDHTTTEHTPLLLPVLDSRMKPPAAAPRGTFSASILAMVSTMMGAGALSLPSTMAHTNVIPSVVLFFLVASIAYGACCACVVAADFTGAYSFESMAAALFGPTRQWFVRFLTLVLLFGVQAVFLLVAIDLLHPFLAQLVSRCTLGALLTALTIPLCLIETMYALRYTNAIVVGCMAYIFVVVGIRAAMVGTWPTSDMTTTSTSTILYALPIQALSFGCQINSVRIYGELKDKTQMAAVNGWTMVLGFVLYVVFSLMGLICFRGMPPADILTGFATDDVMINTVRLVLGASMLLRLPLVSQPFVEVLASVLQPVPRIGDYNQTTVPWPRSMATTLSLVAAFLMAISFKDLNAIMAFVGATADICLNFALPGKKSVEARQMALWDQHVGLFLHEVGARTHSRWAKGLGGGLVAVSAVLAILSVVGLWLG